MFSISTFLLILTAALQFGIATIVTMLLVFEEYYNAILGASTMILISAFSLSLWLCGDRIDRSCNYAQTHLGNILDKIV
jgi:hypothetical protein